MTLGGEGSLSDVVDSNLFNTGVKNMTYDQDVVEDLGTINV